MATRMSALQKQNSRGTKLVDVWRGKWVGRRLGWCEKWPGPVRVERALWGDPCWMGAEHKGKGAVGLPWQRDTGKEKGVCSEAAEEPVSEKLQARYKLGYEVEIENHTNE